MVVAPVVVVAIVVRGVSQCSLGKMGTQLMRMQETHPDWHLQHQYLHVQQDPRLQVPVTSQSLFCNVYAESDSEAVCTVSV